MCVSVGHVETMCLCCLDFKCVCIEGQHLYDSNYHASRCLYVTELDLFVFQWSCLFGDRKKEKDIVDKFEQGKNVTYYVIAAS